VNQELYCRNLMKLEDIATKEGRLIARPDTEVRRLRSIAGVRPKRSAIVLGTNRTGSTAISTGFFCWGDLTKDFDLHSTEDVKTLAADLAALGLEIRSRKESYVHECRHCGHNIDQE
jgi:hypothetical protein